MATRTQDGPGTAIQPANRVKELLNSSADRLRSVLPRHMTPEKQIQVVTTLIFKTPQLQQCDPLSIVAAVMEASELGLSLSKSAGEAYLVPYWNKKAQVNEAQFIPGYRGLCKLMYQSDFVALVDARIVREGDEFHVAYEPDLQFRHVPCLDSDGRRATHAYAFVKLRTGERKVEVMTLAQIEAVRSRSKSSDSGPWMTDYEEMCKKTVLRRVSKTLPRSEMLSRAIEADEREYENGPRSVVSAAPGSLLTRRGVEGLTARLEGPTEDVVLSGPTDDDEPSPASLEG
jgi:recombination protein RecT